MGGKELVNPQFTCKLHIHSTYRPRITLQVARNEAFHRGEVEMFEELLKRLQQEIDDEMVTVDGMCGAPLVNSLDPADIVSSANEIAIVVPYKTADCSHE